MNVTQQDRRAINSITRAFNLAGMSDAYATFVMDELADFLCDCHPETIKSDGAHDLMRAVSGL